jgi:hypothetical protein
MQMVKEGLSEELTFKHISTHKVRKGLFQRPRSRITDFILYITGSSQGK